MEALAPHAERSGYQTRGTARAAANQGAPGSCAVTVPTGTVEGPEPMTSGPSGAPRSAWPGTAADIQRKVDG